MEFRKKGNGGVKALFTGEHKGFFIYTAVITVVFFVLFFLILPGNNLINWLRAKADIRHQNAQIEYYNQQIEEIDKEINTLTTDRDSLERFAREQFQYAAPGDDVYIIEE